MADEYPYTYTLGVPVTCSVYGPHTARRRGNQVGEYWRLAPWLLYFAGYVFLLLTVFSLQRQHVADRKVILRAIRHGYIAADPDTGELRVRPPTEYRKGR